MVYNPRNLCSSDCNTLGRNSYHSNSSSMRRTLRCLYCPCFRRRYIGSIRFRYAFCRLRYRHSFNRSYFNSHRFYQTFIPFCYCDYKKNIAAGKKNLIYGGAINSSAEILPHYLSSSFVQSTKHRIILAKTFFAN